MTRSSNPLRSLACVLLLSVAGPPAGAGPGQGNAVDDYNFSAWLYNQGKYGLAAESYRAFLDAHPGHEQRIDARFGLAQSLFQLNRFSEAADEYEKVRAEKTDFEQMPEALFQLGQCRVALNRFADASGLFEALRKQFPTHYLADWALARQAACLISLDHHAAAVELLADFLGRYAPAGKAPDTAPATRKMFETLDQAGVKARDAFLELIERSAFHLAIAQFNQSQFDEAAASFDAFLALYRNSPLREEASFRLAQAHYRRGLFDKAADVYAAVAKGTGECAEAAGFEQGLALYKAGKLKEAANTFAALAQRFPRGAKVDTARLYSGTFLYEAGDFPGAVQRLKPLAAAGQGEAHEAAYWLGMALLKTGKPGEAAAAFEEALAAFPSSARRGDMQLGLADALLAGNQLEGAAAAFRRYAEQSPSAEQAPRALYSACVALHRDNRYEASDQTCSEFMARFAKSDLAPLTVFLSAENRFLAKRYPEAAQRYAECLGRGDTTAEHAARAHFRLAWIHRYAKRHRDALAALDKMDPQAAGSALAAETHYLRGASFFDLADFTNAAAALSAYLQSSDHERYGDDALLKQGVAEAKQDKLNEAAATFERFLKAHPAGELLPQARYQLAEVRYRLKQFDPAIDSYRAVARQTTETNLVPYALFGVAQCLHEQGKWGEAVEAFEATIRQAPPAALVPQALYRKSLGLMKQNRWDQAAESLELLLKDHAKHDLAAAARIALGTCLQEQGQWESAALAFRDAIASGGQDKDHARLMYELAWSRREAGQEKEALAAFKDLADQFPDHPLAADAYFHLGEAKYAEKDAAGAESEKDKTQRLTAARTLYEKALAVSADRRLGDKLHYRIGWCHWLTGAHAAAAEAFDRLIKEYPDSELLPDALFQSAQAHARDGHTETAVERYGQLVDRPAFNKFRYRPEACIGLAECLIARNDPETAVHRLRGVADQYPDLPAAAQAVLLIGKTRYEQKRHDEALASFTDVTRRVKTDVAAQAQFLIGQIHQTREDFQAATVAYLRLIALYGQHREWVAAASFESGKCHEALGNAADARAFYRDVVEKYKDTRWAESAAERLKGM